LCKILIKSITYLINILLIIFRSFIVKKIIFAILALSMVSVAQAEIAGFKTIIVHGYNTRDLYELNSTDADVEKNGDKYWGGSWLPYADYKLHWDSKWRVKGEIAQRGYDLFMKLADEQACYPKGCLIVTHSAGDLVTRYLLDNYKTWLKAAGKGPVNIAAVIDVAGAGGGSELADLFFDARYDPYWFLSPIYAVVSWFLGGSPNLPDELGVINDLRVNVARQIATTPNSIPRLRFVSGGDDTFVGITKPFIKGTDDSVVGLHSACGAINNRAIDSCSKGVKIDGKVASANGPDGLLYAHYPVLQSPKVSHLGIIRHPDGNGYEVDGNLNYVYNDFVVNGLDVDFDTYIKTTGWWWWKADNRRVFNADRVPMYAIMINTLDR
jgi:hypothetical protein